MPDISKTLLFVLVSAALLAGAVLLLFLGFSYILGTVDPNIPITSK